MLFFSLPLYISKRAAKQYLELYEENELQLDRNECYRQKKTELLRRAFISASRFAVFIEETKGTPYTCFRFGKNYPRKRRNTSSIEHDIKFGDYMYIAIGFFDHGVSRKMEEVLKRYRDRKGLILDLRNNTGGSIEECMKISRLLLPSCDIAELRYPGKTIIYTSDEARFGFQRIFILVNGYTASCGEILALTLRAHLNEAAVIGNRTAGKDIGQRTFNHRKKRILFTVSSFYWTVEGETAISLRNIWKRTTRPVYPSYQTMIITDISILSTLSLQVVRGRNMPENGKPACYFIAVQNRLLNGNAVPGIKKTCCR
ncbi:S41 family peptidase [Paenibacillus larvae]|uniref:S41 family peptidase n=1 Tax=Paenibacillus larvae TaxID=1464 RepID=UPI00288ECCC3|nr:S41 family peptidase [Paenibacillus larvae]MDT2191598.1 S41 family peptidase [Paenibacillus larvae]